MPDNPGSTTSESLLSRIKNAENDAWNCFVQIYGPLIYRWCRKTPLQPHDAADVAQAVFATVHLKISSFDANMQGATFRGWLWTVTRSRICDHLRILSQRETAVGGDDFQRELLQLASNIPAEEPPELRNNNAVAIRAISQLRSKFSPQTWDAFWRATVLREPVSQISDEMNLSAWAIYQAKSRVLRRARQELSDLLSPAWD